MKLLIITIICICSFNQIKGQDSTLSHPRIYPNNSIFFEIAGTSLFFGSLNYERVFFYKNLFYLTGRTGIGYGNFLGTSVLSVPIHLNGIFQLYRALAFEVGIGVSLMRIGQAEEMGSRKWTYENIAALNLILGLRVQDKKGFLLKVDFTPFYPINDQYLFNPSNGFHPYFGLSLGYSFGKKKNDQQLTSMQPQCGASR